MSKSACSVGAARGAQKDADDYADDEFRHEPHSNLDKRDYSTRPKNLAYPSNIGAVMNYAGS
jgi:hypothetical protein